MNTNITYRTFWCSADIVTVTRDVIYEFFTMNVQTLREPLTCIFNCFWKLKKLYLTGSSTWMLLHVTVKRVAWPRSRSLLISRSKVDTHRRNRRPEMGTLVGGNRQFRTRGHENENGIDLTRRSSPCDQFSPRSISNACQNRLCPERRKMSTIHQASLVYASLIRD